MESLAGELLQSVTVSGQHLHLLVHVLDLLTVTLYLDTLTAELHTGLDPPQDAVIGKETGIDDDTGRKTSGIPEETAVRPVP